MSGLKDMSKLKFELNKEGVRQLMRSSEMMAVCESYARKAHKELGTGYKVDKYVGTNRVNVSVAADTQSAREENSKKNSILRAVKSV